MRKMWYLGNTTVRSPFRLKDGLIALKNSNLEGDLHGKDQEIAFRNILGENGIVSLKDDDSYSVGRKWRSALSQLGFIIPEIKSNKTINQDSIGKKDSISENGLRLINANNISAIQECFLRSLAAYYIPSVQEDDYEFEKFSPLIFTLKILIELKKITGNSALYFHEMAVFVQTSSPQTPYKSIIDKILNYREKYQHSLNKKKFLKELYEKSSIEFSYAEQTFRDYADTNFRYLKSTGLVHSTGRGISLVEEKRLFIENLINNEKIPKDDLSYLQGLCHGATLPTDDKDTALTVLNDLLDQLTKNGIHFDLSNKPTKTTADIEILRHEIEERLFQIKEEKYANDQKNHIDEISNYMELLITHRQSKKNKQEFEIKIPTSEAPAYFEWIIWRAFLAINSLKNKPWEARRFKIDQDFLPIGTAPGNGPDLIFEFPDFTLVVEVTLTSSSRQEAAEGEPVRRHVAHYAVENLENNKPVFGLFLALDIDTNTANTFRLGEWYLKDDKKIDLHIVPIPLSDFKIFFDSGKINLPNLLPALKELLRDCRMYANKNAPEWKESIRKIIQNKIKY